MFFSYEHSHTPEGPYEHSHTPEGSYEHSHTPEGPYEHSHTPEGPYEHSYTPEGLWVKTAYAVSVQTCPSWSNVTYELLTLYKLLNITLMVKGQFQRFLYFAFHQGCTFIDAYYKAATNLVARIQLHLFIYILTEEYQNKLLLTQVSIWQLQIQPDTVSLVISGVHVSSRPCLHSAI